MQWCLTVRALVIYIRATGNKKFSQFLLTLFSRDMQECSAVLTLCIDFNTLDEKEFYYSYMAQFDC